MFLLRTNKGGKQAQGRPPTLTDRSTGQSQLGFPHTQNFFQQNSSVKLISVAVEICSRFRTTIFYIFSRHFNKVRNDFGNCEKLQMERRVEKQHSEGVCEHTPTAVVHSQARLLTAASAACCSLQGSTVRQSVLDHLHAPPGERKEPQQQQLKRFLMETLVLIERSGTNKAPEHKSSRFKCAAVKG